MKNPYWDTNIDPLLQDFDKLSSIEKYKYIENIRSILREIQKLSFRINQFDKKFPFEQSKEPEYKQLLTAYFDFLVDIRGLSSNIGVDLF